MFTPRTFYRDRSITGRIFFFLQLFFFFFWIEELIINSHIHKKQFASRMSARAIAARSGLTQGEGGGEANSARRIPGRVDPFSVSHGHLDNVEAVGMENSGLGLCAWKRFDVVALDADVALTAMAQVTGSITLLSPAIA